jgi:1-aminocyclopropane-1-carboxylate deaminase
MSDYLEYHATPIQKITDPAIEKAGVQLLVKREDLNHSTVSGNKWWKLKYNFLQAQKDNYRCVLTFGGVYSNHIYSTAAAASMLGFKSIGMIRGDEKVELNDTLKFALQQGMTLEYVSRGAYRAKGEPAFLSRLKEKFHDFYLIPEGGTNLLAIKGCEELAQTLEEIPFDAIFLPVGTAGTICGFITGLGHRKAIYGVSVLKGGDFLVAEIENWLREYSNQKLPPWTLLTNYHHGGYAKVSPELASFIQRMSTMHRLPLDPVYTGKLFWAIFEEIKKGHFKRGTTVLAVHTGGLQGSRAFSKST